MKEYKVMELFYSIQGEGYHTGKPAFFIRLAGCTVGCSWCDVKESWSEDNSTSISANTIVEEALKHGATKAIITGGEPTLQNLSTLTSELQKVNIKTHLETSGVCEITGFWDWICISPKRFKPPLVAEISKAQELKIVVVNKLDCKWAEKYATYVHSNCKLFLQPEWSRSEKGVNIINNYIKKNPKWRISLQTHKYMNIR